MRIVQPAGNRISGLTIALATFLGACGGGGDSGSPAPVAPAPVVVNAPACTQPAEGPSAPAGPLVIGGDITGRPGNPSFIYVAEGDGKHPFLFYGPDFANSSTITGFIRVGFDARGCAGVDLSTDNGSELGLHVELPLNLQVSATTRPPSLSGSIRDKAGTYALTASSIPGSSYDMSAPATVASAAGFWILSDMWGSRMSVAVDSAGNVTGNYGCPFTGVLSPSPESVNLLRVQLSMTGSGCASGAVNTGPYEGFALVMPLTSGGSQLLIWAEWTDGWDSANVLAMGRR